MKTVQLLFVTIFVCVAFQSVQAQYGKQTLQDRTKTQVIKVYGECGMCEKRIEKVASSVEGITAAHWDEDTQQLTLKYDMFKKNAPDSAQQKIARAGHDTEKYTADDAAYKKLPGCCHYQRKQ